MAFNDTAASMAAFEVARGHAQRAEAAAAAARQRQAAAAVVSYKEVYDALAKVVNRAFLVRNALRAKYPRTWDKLQRHNATQVWAKDFRNSKDSRDTMLPALFRKF